MTNELDGIRIHLAASIREDLASDQKASIENFVEILTREVLKRGGVLVHGTHPSIVPSIRKGAAAFLQADGSKDSIVLVRSTDYEDVPDQLAIQLHRQFATVESIPRGEGDLTSRLVPMREWMAERCDVTIAVGGKWYDVNPKRSGVVNETKMMIDRSKPCFLVSSFGGGVAEWTEQEPSVFASLNNGLSPEENRARSQGTDPVKLVQDILSQLALLPLRIKSIKDKGMFRILCLDGGGIRGAFTAAILDKWAEQLKMSKNAAFVRQFDMVAGTSTGAILAAGLGAGISTNKLMDFYSRHGGKIFDGTGGWWHFVANKYNSDSLVNALAVLENKTFSDSLCRLVIPSIDASTGHSRLFVTPHHPLRTSCRAVELREAVLASTAAPTYFEAAKVPDGIVSQSYVDGGLWANNPALAAIAEAHGTLGIPMDQIDLLSVGTMCTTTDFSNLQNAGQVQYMRPISKLFFASQESATLDLASRMLTKSRFLRINKHTNSLPELDDASSIDKLMAAGRSIAEETFDEVYGRFLTSKNVPEWQKF